MFYLQPDSNFIRGRVLIKRPNKKKLALTCCNTALECYDTVWHKSWVKVTLFISGLFSANFEIKSPLFEIMWLKLEVIGNKVQVWSLIIFFDSFGVNWSQMRVGERTSTRNQLFSLPPAFCCKATWKCSILKNARFSFKFLSGVVFLKWIWRWVRVNLISRSRFLLGQKYNE